MLFRLTFLLVAGLFLLLYFAPDPTDGTRAAARLDAAREDAARQDAARAEAERLEALQPAPKPPAEIPARPAPEIVVATPLPLAEDPVSSNDLADAVAEALANVAASEPDGSEEDEIGGATEPESPVTLPGLTLGGGAGGTADALSLSERLRDRPAEDAADPAATAAQEPERAPLIPQPDGATSEQRALVVGSSVNLRAGPSTQNPIVGKAEFNQTVIYLGEPIPGWASIRNPATGQTAFMASRFLQRLAN